MRSKEHTTRLTESSTNPLDVMSFGSFNQFRDLVAQKTIAAISQFKDQDGNNLLMLAAMSGKLEYVRFLYDQKGFDINAVNVCLSYEETRIYCLAFGHGVWKY